MFFNYDITFYHPSIVLLWDEVSFIPIKFHVLKVRYLSKIYSLSVANLVDGRNENILSEDRFLINFVLCS